VLGTGSALGWTTWLISKKCEQDAEDVVVRPPADSPAAPARQDAKEPVGFPPP